MFKNQLLVALTATVLSTSAFAGHGHDEHEEHGPVPGELCTGFGPQTPRDIDSSKGENTRAFALASDYKQMNLCNIHLHKNAEHKAKDFSVFAGEGHGGFNSGYKSDMKLSKAELAPVAKPACKSDHGELQPGDTIEVHWVHSSADVRPGKTLGACLLPEKNSNPDLRVEAQVFVLVNDKSALNFNNLGYGGNIVNGFHQAKSIPSDTGKPVVFGGSTTGPKYSDSVCSPLQVTWSVRPKAAKLDINSLATWCESNEFGEDHAHGVRKLVTSPKLLSEIK
jgi:hypothetical protein